MDFSIGTGGILNIIAKTFDKGIEIKGENELTV